jgi:signal recognition particle subunit SRP9
MYKSFSSIILNRFESLNLRLLSQIANTKPTARLLAGGLGSGEPSRAGTPGVGVVEDEPMTGTGTTGEVEAEKPTPKTEGKGGAGGGGGGGKKKKKGKR